MRFILVEPSEQTGIDLAHVVLGDPIKLLGEWIIPKLLGQLHLAADL